MHRSRFRQLTRWVLLVVLIVGVLIAAGAGFYAHQANRARDELAEFILAHPDSTAVVAYTVDDSGAFVEDGLDLFRNADHPLVVASTEKIVVLAAYADAVSKGELNPGERISVADWERYYLPKTDGGAHVAGL